jgi:Cupin-like domain
VKRVQIERKSKVSLADFAREHLHGVGKPVLITDATENWPARSKWTFEFFKTTYGSDVATAWLGRGSVTAKLTNLSTYIDFLDAPWELPGLWIGTDGRPLRAAPERGNSPPYLLGWYAFRQHPELVNDVQPAPYFLLDLVAALNPTLREVFEQTSEREYSAIYIGPEGSLSALHRDYWNTHGYLAQIQGRKRAMLFSPEDFDFLYGGQVDPEQPDFKRFPLFKKAVAYECVIEPGEMLLTPANWWHHVRGLEKSITVSHNFFNDTNFTQHMTHILRNLPRLVQGIERSPNRREKLRIKWGLSDFAAADVPTTVWNWSGFRKPRG